MPSNTVFDLCSPASRLLQMYPSMTELKGHFPQTEESPYLYTAALFSVSAVYPYRCTLEPWNGFCLLYTENGQGSLSFQKNTIVLAQQKLFLWPCHHGFSIRTVSSHWNHFLLFLGGREMEYFYRHFSCLTEQPLMVPTDSCLPGLLHSLAKRDATVYASPIQQLFLTTGLLTEVLSLPPFQQKDLFCPDYLLAIRRMLDEEYQMPCSLDLLEKRFRVNKYRIAREFAQYFHQPPISYLNTRRIQAAKNLLISTDDKILEISQKTGFGSPNLFIRSFKKETGMTPRVYRTENSKIHL